MEKLAWQLMLQSRVSPAVDDASRRASAVSATDQPDFCSGESGAPAAAGTPGRRGRASVADSPATRPPDGGERPGPTDEARDRDEFGDLG